LQTLPWSKLLEGLIPPLIWLAFNPSVIFIPFYTL
jgi:hypothetical protein